MSKAKNPFVSKGTPTTEAGLMFEARAHDHSIVIENNQGIRDKSDDVIVNNIGTVNIQVCPSTRDIKALGVPRPYGPKSKYKSPR